MGKHKDTWALDIISKIKGIGDSLGYVTAQEEERITRGWIDVAWKLGVIDTGDPLYVLTCEVETSKSNWVQIRNNAAKLVPLKPLIYCHIFKPPIVLTEQEKSQLSGIHPGRHVLIYDGNTDLDNFLKVLSSFNKKTIIKNLVAYVMVEVDYTRHSSLMQYINNSPEIISASEIFGPYDFLLAIGMEQFDMSKISNVIMELSKMQLIKRSSSFIVRKAWKYT